MTEWKRIQALPVGDTDVQATDDGRVLVTLPITDRPDNEWVAAFARARLHQWAPTDVVRSPEGERFIRFGPVPIEELSAHIDAILDQIDSANAAVGPAREAEDAARAAAEERRHRTAVDAVDKINDALASRIRR